MKFFLIIFLSFNFFNLGFSNADLKHLKNSIGYSELWLSKDVTTKLLVLNNLLPKQAKEITDILLKGKSLNVLAHYFGKNEPDELIIEIKNLSIENMNQVVAYGKKLDPNFQKKVHKGYDLYEFKVDKTYSLTYLEKSLFISSNESLLQWLSRANLYDNDKFKWSWKLRQPEKTADIELRLNGVLSINPPERKIKIWEHFTKAYGLKKIESFQFVYDLQIDKKGKVFIHIQTPWVRTDSPIQKLVAPKRMSRPNLLALRKKEVARFDIPGFPMASWLEWIRVLEYRYKTIFGKEFDADLLDLDKDFGQNLNQWFKENFYDGIHASFVLDSDEKIVKYQVDLKNQLDPKLLKRFLELMDYKEEEVEINSYSFWKMIDSREREFYLSSDDKTSLIILDSELGSKNKDLDMSMLKNVLQIDRKKTIERGNVFLLSKFIVIYALEDVWNLKRQPIFEMLKGLGIEPMELLFNDARIDHYYESGANQVEIETQINLENAGLILEKFSEIKKKN